jgi:hypothetical protein
MGVPPPERIAASAAGSGKYWEMSLKKNRQRKKTIDKSIKYNIFDDTYGNYTAFPVIFENSPFSRFEGLVAIDAMDKFEKFGASFI